jgi:hypothetical protein
MMVLSFPLTFMENKGKRKPKGQSRMDNPEIQEILGKRHRTKSNKAKRHKTEN